MIKLDAIDFKLIEALQKDSKQSIKQLAEGVNLSITPVHERIKKLESSGVIHGYTAIIDYSKLGKTLIVYCQVTLTTHQDEPFRKFEAYVNTLEDVIEANYIAGTYDVLLKILLNDMNEYQEFILKRFSKMTIVSHIQSSFVIKNIKDGKNKVM
ncbi:Lrp/AsnC family transcriptional regulator [Formosa sediminum]|uniref:Lrp/AsnC family transcriptional regulator n=1 Tax=Formosa sediminum TaxID=2594004 RepID=A0A516GV83_9FLAO|nr:Lrp/AsnC family transcriptional regulator [Formosa sediminum]QDO95433.1 Lrp/AsnC family transcriptional regulator [Formosa sediminum]